MFQKAQKKKIKSIKYINNDMLRGNYLFKNVLFPFCYEKWLGIVNEELNKCKVKNFMAFKNSILYLEICSIYKMKYCKNK